MESKLFRRRVRSVVTASRIFLDLRRSLLREREGTLSEASKILIEGFPRSANSFSEAAFRLAQPEQIDIAHHSHAPAQVIQAVKWKIPSVILIRDPIEAARSLLMHQPNNFDARSALWEYDFFYSQVAPWRGGYILARFGTVVSDFGTVIGAVNRRFGTNFSCFQHTPENALAALDAVDETSRKRGTIAVGTVEPYSPRIDPEEKKRREERKRETRAAVISAENADLLQRASAIYRMLSADADV